MKRRSKLPPAELTMTDGQRHLGRIIEKAAGWEVFGPDDKYLFKVPTLAEARAAIVQRGRKAGA